MIGDLLRNARKNARLSQEKLAERAGVHRNFISLVERNLQQPTIDTFVRICKAMNIKACKIIAKIEGEVRLPEDFDDLDTD